MGLRWCVLATVLVAVYARDNRNDGPKFVSHGNSFRAIVGDTLLLPCQVQNLGSLVLLWRRGPAVLTAASLMVTRDDRFRLIDGYNLQITDVGPHDAGDYVCQVSDRVTKDQVHTVEVLVPPSMKASPESRHATVRRGGAAVFECRASGNPVPTVTWHKLNGTKTKVGEGPQLQLTSLEREHSGKYGCTADNGVGPAIVTKFHLQVLYDPEIIVDTPWIHTGEGFAATLLCTVMADPPAAVRWYKNSVLLNQSEHYTMSARGNNHTLFINKVRFEDFNNYSCDAENSLGRSRQNLEISGRPGSGRILSPPLSRAKTSYTVSFVLDSYLDLDELRILYRLLAMNESVQQAGRWHDTMLPIPKKTGPLSYYVTYKVEGLEPGSTYEGLVQARNEYGWNEMNNIFLFHTMGGANSVHADELSPMFSSAAKHRLMVYAALLGFYGHLIG